MKFSVQVIVHPDDDTKASPVVREVLTFDRDDLAPDTLGLQLAEAKDLLAVVQETVVEQQASTAVTKQVACPDCGRARRHKDMRTIVVRTLFGALRLASPRWWHCGCRCQRTRTFQPVAGLLPERTTPELASLSRSRRSLPYFVPLSIYEVLPRLPPSAARWPGRAASTPHTCRRARRRHRRHDVHGPGASNRAHMVAHHGYGVSGLACDQP